MILKLFMTSVLMAIFGLLVIRAIGETEIPDWLTALLVVITILGLVFFPIFGVLLIWFGVGT